jgi:A/G-specific adenine glycosylase
VRRRLLSWFARHRRDLPWRHNRDPYRIWISEVMLQQTQVATVIPYFERFLQAFPTLTALAAAEEQQVLRLWEGLGYYRRARDLLRAARLMVAEHGGAFPNEPAVLQRLPGMGRYTVGAVLSQAFERRLPILEANSQRVLSRFFGRRGDPRTGEARKWLWQAAETLLPRRLVGEFNQALMELGSLVCTATTPQCEKCPLASRCQARRLRLQEAIPARPARMKITEVEEVAVVVRRGRQVLLVQRPAGGRWAGLWEFPHDARQPGEPHERAALRILHEFVGVEAVVGSELLTIRHGVTHYRITLVCLEARHSSGEYQSTFYAQGQWLEPEQLHGHPVSAPQRRLAQALTEEMRQRQLF